MSVQLIQQYHAQVEKIIHDDGQIPRWTIGEQFNTCRFVD